MDEINQTTNDQVWNMINKEKQRDKRLKIISWVSWGMVLLVLLIFMLLTFMDFSKTMNQYHSGVIPYERVLATFVPLLIILGSLSLIVAVVVTIGRFMRLRTTNLLEIQQRLTHLEELVTSKKD